MENSNFLVRNSAAMTFKLEIDFWLAHAGGTDIDWNDCISCLQASILCL